METIITKDTIKRSTLTIACILVALQTFSHRHHIRVELQPEGLQTEEETQQSSSLIEDDVLLLPLQTNNQGISSSPTVDVSLPIQNVLNSTDDTDSTVHIDANFTLSNRTFNYTNEAEEPSNHTGFTATTATNKSGVSSSLILPGNFSVPKNGTFWPGDQANTTATLYTNDTNENNESVVPSLTPFQNHSGPCDSTGQYCAPTALEGKWVHVGKEDRQRTFHAPTCCTWDHDVFDELTDVCGTHHWKETGTFNASADRYQGATRGSFPVQTGGHACACRGDRAFTDEYVWESPTTLPEHFDPRRACQLLRDRTVLIVGDSTGQQFASVVMNALQPAGCGTQVHFSLADTLLKLRHDRGHHWYEEFVRVQPDILVWGVGPHVYGADKFRYIFESVVANMTAIQEEQRQTGKKVTEFVYKSQQPGGCDQKPHLLPADEAAMDMVRQNLTLDYNYGVYYDRDLYALSYLAEIGMPVLDLRMLYARPEAHVDAKLPHKNHRDCLHLCIPGPLDVAADLFQNLLSYTLRDHDDTL